MRLYLGLENYDGFSAQDFETLNIDGLVIGDPFCTYKMFKYGDSDLMEVAKMVSQLEKEVIYQTPNYITDRNFSDVTKKIACLYDKYGVNQYLVQDVGLADWLHSEIPNSIVIWGHWGKNRNSLMNLDFISFLKTLGVTAIETSLPERIREIPKVGLSVFAVFGNTVYNTLSRECYNSYMLNRFDKMCERECLNGNMSLINENLRMTIDGHVLGQKLWYQSDQLFFDAVSTCANSSVVYAKDYLSSLRQLEVYRKNIKTNKEFL